MATLNSLRTKGGIFLSLVIGLALVAFILGDLFSSNGIFSSRKMRVGSIDGNKVSYVEYLNLSENQSRIIERLYGKNALSAEETDQVRNMVWENLVLQYAYQPGFEALGIVAGEDEQVDMVSGTYISPVISSMFVNPQTGMFDQSILSGFVSSLDSDPDGSTTAIWLYLKDQMNSQRVMNKYVNLVGAGVFVNDLEVENALAVANDSFDARYVQLPFYSVPDSTISVSESEIKAYYKANKNIFKQGASRDIEYVVFDVLPSDDDFAAAEKYITDIAAEFEQSTTPMQYATLNSQSAVDKRYYKENDLPLEYAAIAFGAKKGEMYGPVLEGDVYKLARVAEIKSMPDSVGVKHVLLPASEKALADSLFQVVKSGKNTIEAVAAQYSSDPTCDLGRMAPDVFVEPFAEACIAAKQGDVFTVETQYGIHIVNLTYKAPSVNKAQIASIVYNVEPSDATQQAIYAQARDFMGLAEGSYEKFDNAVSQKALVRRQATVSSMERNVRGLDDSRELVRWIFNNKKGDVSSILDVNGDYVVASVTGVKESGVAPLAQVSSQIRSKLVRQKKAEMLAAKMQGLSIAEAAELEGASDGNIEKLTFSAFYVPSLGVEPALIGAVCGGAEQGKVSKPVTGVTGVFLAEVTGVEKTGDATAESERVRLEALATGYLAERVSQALDAQSQIVDNRVKFF